MKVRCPWLQYEYGCSLTAQRLSRGSLFIAPLSHSPAAQISMRIIIESAPGMVTKLILRSWDPSSVVAEPEMICQLTMSREHPCSRFWLRHASARRHQPQPRYDAFSKSLIKLYARNIFFVSLCLALCRRLFPVLQNPRPTWDLKSTMIPIWSRTKLDRGLQKRTGNLWKLVTVVINAMFLLLELVRVFCVKARHLVAPSSVSSRSHPTRCQSLSSLLIHYLQQSLQVTTSILFARSVGSLGESHVPTFRENVAYMIFSGFSQHLSEYPSFMVSIGLRTLQ